MKKHLISPIKNQYKANLHCHSTCSDGKLSPKELKELYKTNGYDILAITDHCRPKNHGNLTDEKFLMITGYEAYIRPSEGFKFDKFGSEVHLNLFAKSPENETLICYNKASVKYIPEDEFKTIKRAGSEEPRKYSTDYINQFIKTANDNGYLVAYNHPVWSMEYEERILSYENIFSLEMYNTSSYIGNNIENGEVLYDKMLRCGMHIGCHGGDDNHNKHPFNSPYNDSCLFHTMIISDKLEYSSVINAMETKDFYVSNGPKIYELTVIDGQNLYIKTSEVSKVFLFYGSLKSSVSVRLPHGDTETSFVLKIPEDAKYIRLTVYDENGGVANTRGYFPEEWKS